jgi:Ca-activated chloride channel family protein
VIVWDSTLDYDAFAQSLSSVDVGIIPRGGTALTRAIDAGIDAFEGAQGKYEALILITDGEDHEGDAAEAAERAADRGIKIFTVGIGTLEGELIPLAERTGAQFLKDREGKVVKSRLDESGLQSIAEKTGGAYLRAGGRLLGLEGLFKDHIATMERRELKSTIERRYEDRFQVPLAIAVLLLAVEAMIGDRRRAWPTWSNWMTGLSWQRMRSRRRWNLRWLGRSRHGRQSEAGVAPTS